MKKRKAKIVVALFIYIMCMTALAPKVKATEVSSGEFPVTINVGDSLGYSDEKFEIEFKAEHPDNPMPEGSKDGVYSMYITGPNTSLFPKIEYPDVGTYTYTISQKFDSDEIDEYDTKTFLLKVQVTRSQTTNLLQAVSTMYVLGQDAKVAGAVFYNAPPPLPVDPTPEPTQEPTQKPTSEVKGADFDNTDRPRTSDETTVLPYLMLFISGAGMIVFLGLSTTRKSRRIIN